MLLYTVHALCHLPWFLPPTLILSFPPKWEGIYLEQANSIKSPSTSCFHRGVVVFFFPELDLWGSNSFQAVYKILGLSKSGLNEKHFNPELNHTEAKEIDLSNSQTHF